MRRVLVAALAGTLLAACTNSDDSSGERSPSTSPASLRLGSIVACSEVFFFAGGDQNLLVVEVDPDQRDPDGSLDKTFTLPADGIRVDLRRGEGLGQPCYDVAPDDYRVDSITSAVGGTIVVTLDPSAPNPGPFGGDCGSRGQADVQDLVLADGTSIDDVIITGNEVGCTGG